MVHGLRIDPILYRRSGITPCPEDQIDMILYVYHSAYFLFWQPICLHRLDICPYKKRVCPIMKSNKPMIKDFFLLK